MQPTDLFPLQSTEPQAVTFPSFDVGKLLDRYAYSPEIRETILRENLLPPGLLSRLHRSYPAASSLATTESFIFHGKNIYAGIEGFREVIAVLASHGIDLGGQQERELFIEVYAFMASRHLLNSIDWTNWEHDALFHLVFPNTGMIPANVVADYLAASTAEARTAVAALHRQDTNPHDGNQLLNRPWFINDRGEVELVEGSQHKYPQCQLIFDKTTQNCFAYCTYCFRHAQLAGDKDMFLQKDVAQIHAYLRQHQEVTDLLITGGDAGFMSPARFRQYALPIVTDPSLLHLRTIRFASRALSYQPEMILSPAYDKMLEVFDMLRDNGVQLAWMAHFSTPREVLNPSTIAAIRRLQNHGVVVRSQSPVMKHISMYEGEDGHIDVDRSAQNWIDLGNLMATLRVGFHSMYCARPTGEQQYFSAPLAEVNAVASKVYRSLSSINRPSRYLSMTTSAGKISILGTAIVNGQKALALKFTQGRKMEWLDRVFLAKYNEEFNSVGGLEPFDTEDFFFKQELAEIEAELEATLSEAMRNSQENLHASVDSEDWE